MKHLLVAVIALMVGYLVGSLQPQVVTPDREQIEYAMKHEYMCREVSE